MELQITTSSAMGKAKAELEDQMEKMGLKSTNVFRNTAGSILKSDNTSHSSKVVQGGVNFHKHQAKMLQ